MRHVHSALLCECEMQANHIFEMMTAKLSYRFLQHNNLDHIHPISIRFVLCRVHSLS